MEASKNILYTVQHVMRKAIEIQGSYYDKRNEFDKGYLDGLSSYLLDFNTSLDGLISYYPDMLGDGAEETLRKMTGKAVSLGEPVDRDTEYGDGFNSALEGADQLLKSIINDDPDSSMIPWDKRWYKL